ncbi:hypothetical protein MKX03_025395 [Papaver bracteatum]|nr:hypothetical protein MKX03_025395 [Papaver bracteatum]
MDVLQGSIDVRELLSTHDIEESSPFSAPDLHLLIDRLQIRSLHVKQKVKDYILSHQTEFSQIFSTCSNSISKTEEISTDLSNVVQLLSNNGIDIEIRDASKEICSVWRDLKEKKELLSLAKIIVNLVERLKVVKENLKVGELINAAESLRDLKKDLLIHDDDRKEVGDKREPVVFKLLRKEWFDCFDELQEVCVRILGNAIRFDSGNGRLRVVFKLSIEKMKDVELRMVLRAMEVAGVLDYGLAKVADLTVKYIIIPTVNDESNFHIVEELLPTSEKMDEAILSLVASSSDFKVESANIYSRLIQVINFIHKTVCFQNGRWMTCFGRLTWPRISNLVISEFLSKDVCLSSARVAMEFYHAARDVLFLYEAIMPVKLEKQLDNVTQIAALVHNDCLFLTQEVLGLAFEYRPDFPSCIKEQAVFVDIAPRFHQMADELLQKQIQLVCINLEKAIDGADGFQNTHQLQQYESAKSSIDQVVFILEKVRSIWEPLFLQSIYKSSILLFWILSVL